LRCFETFSVTHPLALVIDARVSPNLEIKHKKQNNNLFAIMLLDGKDATVFLETSNFIRGFVEDNVHRKSASHSRLSGDFVLSFVLIIAFIVK